mmetsp:Transcript_32149/g.80913  ORF Transcript_32149/g.80913 Transcript_32149/m.80913 type:complete len:186 (-) Transcript_32149:53-610(-)
MANHLESITGSGPVLPVGSFARYFAFTVPEGHDLLQIITDYAKNNQLPAAYVVSCVGSVSNATLKCAPSKKSATAKQGVKTLKGNFVVCNMQGTLSGKYSKICAQFSNKNGEMYGGELVGGVTVSDTCEVVICVMPGIAVVPDGAGLPQVLSAGNQWSTNTIAGFGMQPDQQKSAPPAAPAAASP